MPEFQSCPSTVSVETRTGMCSLECAASLLLDCKEQKVTGENVDVSVELQREREKNAVLMKRISLLEAQLMEKQDSCPTCTDEIFKKRKRQKIEPAGDDAEVAQSTKQNGGTPSTAREGANHQERSLVNWMNMDDTQVPNFEKFKSEDFEVGCDDSDDNDGVCDEDCTEIDDGNRIYDGNSELVEDLDGLKMKNYSESLSEDQSKLAVSSSTKEGGQTKAILLPDTRVLTINEELKVHKREEEEKIKGSKVPLETSISSHKKPPKVPFCPKEIKRIMGSEALLLKNAQAHTLRKILVFASLGIRHGCEDMYELDFSHFSILQKGEPYASPKNPGEHVLYEHPGVRRKVFYPNTQNPTLCPVQILQEEKDMRSSDSSCPSCLFLCIKYGGRSRNLPQNEYVRQRMGRNKLKSFGPIMCQMAMLAHTRSGSFFFKALGITLLFMAGFPDDLVQKETKYGNLDLLQKYYRSDKDAEGEDLFHLYPMLYDAASPNSQQLTVKATKSHSRKQKSSKNKSHDVPRSSITPSDPSTSAPTTQFGLMGYTFPSHTPNENMPIINPSVSSPMLAPTPYPIFPPYLVNTFMPMPYWPPANTFPSCAYPCPSNYASVHPPYIFGYPVMPKVVEGGTDKKDMKLDEGSSESGSSSSSIK